MTIKILDLNFNSVIKTEIITDPYELAIVMYGRYYGRKRYGKNASKFNRIYSDLETVKMYNDLDCSGVVIVNCD